ncbi:exo-alpha-sialidase [Pedobacter sp. L105]|uniref:exo-alpha-sialidase n=1 Tax=Pedobacter sp. L105 TaxID=1641871 RepID=UPI00131C94FC|nr:exo-alpha-sialidase [Pedobacter sp. L105]
MNLLFSLSFSISYAQNSLVSNNYTTEKGLKHLKIERATIYTPDTNWFYNHHPSVTKFKGKFFAIWSNGIKDEDSPGQRVVIATSSNFKDWSAPVVLASPSLTNDTLNVLTAAGFHQFKDTLVAYYGEYTKRKIHTRLWAKTTTDGIHWSEPIDMHMPVIPNHGPEPTQSGRLIISGNFLYPYTDDYRGLSGWKRSSFYPDSLLKQDNSTTFYKPAEKTGVPPLCEGSFYQTDDAVLHLLVRVTGKGWKGRLWLSQSADNGEKWSKPVETPFSDNDSKFHFGRLPDKNYYYAGIPDTLHHYDRNPLVLALSADGKHFDRQFIIADEPYHIKKNGLWKGGEYGYPHTMIDEGWMYVIISRKKEAIELIRFPLAQLKK